MSVRVRFAPSPTGHLHVGNVRTALYNWLFARQNGGTFLLRIEDTDLARSEQVYEQQLIEDLRWLGLTWDEGVEVGGSLGPYRQTDRFLIYRRYAERLLQEGHAYYCFCSPEELEVERRRQMGAGQPLRYTGKCRSLDPAVARERLQTGQTATLRLKVREGRVEFTDMVFGPIGVDCQEIGDFIILRSDGSPQYNFAVVLDDSLMEITHVIRGEGHLSNTPRQLLLYETFGLRPPAFAHLSTILGSDGSKLSKRHGATSIDQFREIGYLPEALLNYLALLGWAPMEEGKEILTPDELVREFDLERVNRSPATFDGEKLNWVNRSHLKRLDRSRLADLCLAYLQQAGHIGPHPDPPLREWVGALAEAVSNYLEVGKDIVSASEVVFSFAPGEMSQDPEVRQILAEEGAREVILEFARQVRTYDHLDFESYRSAVLETKARTGRKGKQLFHPIRVAVTGRASGPELEKIIPLLEQGNTFSLPHRVLNVRQRVEAVLKTLA